MRILAAAAVTITCLAGAFLSELLEFSQDSQDGWAVIAVLAALAFAFLVFGEEES